MLHPSCKKVAGTFFLQSAGFYDASHDVKLAKKEEDKQKENTCEKHNWIQFVVILQVHKVK